VRKSTAIITSIVAVSALAVSLRVGEISTQDNISVDIANPGVTETPSASPDPSSSTNPTTTPTPGSTATSSPKPTTVPAPAAQEVTFKSDVITYKYGVVQVSITKLGTEITAVNLLQGDATNGRDTAYQILIDATLQQQGTNFGNVSGATFTTDAFIKAVDNALLKF
jgi:uncharacterized protein with FMN-binding domain